MRFYIPFTKVSVASGADKTLLVVTAGTNHQVEVEELQVTFFGVDTVQAPIEIQLQRASASGTGTAVTLQKWLDSDGDTIDASAKQTMTVEPTYTGAPMSWAVHPQSGIILPFTKPLVIGAGDILGLLCQDPGTTTSMVGQLICRS